MTGHIFWGFERFSSSIAWRVMELQRFGQHGQVIPFKAKIAQQQKC